MSGTPTGTDWLKNEPSLLASFADRIAVGTVVLSAAEQARVVYLLADLRRRVDHLEHERRMRV